MSRALVVGAAPPALMRIAIAGNPNSGKTTVFNALTGLRMKVANYPGVTVERREGRMRGADAALLDLPGIYSLSARSPDEVIARDVLIGHLEDSPLPSAVLVIVDASNLERNLFLATQVVELGLPTVMALTMMDRVRARGRTIDCALLSARLGVPVVPVVGTTGEGIAALRDALAHVGPQGSRGIERMMPPSLEEAIDEAAEHFRSNGAFGGVRPRALAALWLAERLSDGDSTKGPAGQRAAARWGPTNEKLLATSARLAGALPDAPAAAIEARYRYIARLTEGVISPPASGDPAAAPPDLTDRIDRVLTHRVGGPVVFAAVMFGLFLSIFSGAEPLMDAIEGGQRFVAATVAAALPEGALQSLINDGMIAGVGAVIIFFPQICILFFLLAILEDTGYMARAAFIMDRLMSRVGLHGKSFIPLLSSYACAIPGILATRTIEDRRDRLTTILVAPLMSCSARLPVYLIVIAAVFGDRPMLKSAVLFGMYAFGTVSALTMAYLFKRSLLAGPRPTFIMELPPYRVPRVAGLIRATWHRSKSFLTEAGTVIFAACIVIWALSYFPGPPAMAAAVSSARGEAAGVDAGQPLAVEALAGSERLRSSFLGKLGRLIEPVIEPLGFDWRIGVGLLSSFAAREVFVSTMGITFAVGEADETSPELRHRLASATWPDGSRVLTPLTGIGLMVFYVLACQCVSTLAVVRKETGSWKWPALMFGYMTVLAYFASLAVHQIGLRFHLGA